jgi:hypothetical protein
MKDVGKCYGHFVYFVVIWYILWSFWYILWSFWYILWSFCLIVNLATLLQIEVAAAGGREGDEEDLRQVL